MSKRNGLFVMVAAIFVVLAAGCVHRNQRPVEHPGQHQGGGGCH